MTGFQWFSFFVILFVAFAGGYYPLFKRDRARSSTGFPSGESFSAGVFLALSLIIMFPTGVHLFNKSFPGINYPLASVFAITAFLTLLALEHVAAKLSHAGTGFEKELSSPAIPIIMTVMIAIPSFLLGTALGVSGNIAALFIFVAVLTHKGSAGFGLALTMVRSRLTRKQTFLLYALFAFSTPIGILVGADIHTFLRGDAMVVLKACILSLAAGVFLYLSTVHEFKQAPLIKHCSGVKRFTLMFLGLLITALVRLVLGLAHGGS